MDKIVLQPDRFYGTVFALVNLTGKSYVCPGWHEVPVGTTREQIEFDMSKQPLKQETVPEVRQVPLREWKVEASKPGNFYNVSDIGGSWDCSCPAKMFNRGDCKHIKLIKTKQR